MGRPILVEKPTARVALADLTRPVLYGTRRIIFCRVYFRFLLTDLDISRHTTCRMPGAAAVPATNIGGGIDATAIASAALNLEKPQKPAANGECKILPRK